MGVAVSSANRMGYPPFFPPQPVAWPPQLGCAPPPRPTLFARSGRGWRLTSAPFPASHPSLGSHLPPLCPRLRPSSACPSSSILNCEPFFPLRAFKNAPNPKFVQNLSRRLFFGVPIRRTQICQKFAENLKICPEIVVFQFFGNFSQIWVPLIGTPKNNHRDKFWTNLGFGAFLNAVRGKKGSQILIPRCQR